MAATFAMLRPHLGRCGCTQIQFLPRLISADIIILSRRGFSRLRTLHDTPIQRPKLPLMMCRQHQLLRNATSCNRVKSTEASATTSSTNHHSFGNHQSLSKQVVDRQDYIIFERTRTLLSPTRHHNNNNDPVQRFMQMLDLTRRDERLLRKMQLNSDEAKDMFILPQALLTDVHSAIMYFSKKEHFQGMVITQNEEEEEIISAKQVTSSSRGKKKLPGPIICAKLLELIGIPHVVHASSSSSSSSTPLNSPLGSTTSVRTIVHSSQIDQILECCLETTAALSRSCQTGKYSLLGGDFTWQSSTTGHEVQVKGEKKSAAQLCEEIWRSVWNLQIKYTSGRNTFYRTPPRIRIGRIGSIGNASNPVEEYLSVTRDGRIRSENNAASENNCADESLQINNDTTHWSPKDHRRYDKSVIIFNNVLASYAKLSSSESGVRPEVRRELVQKAEQLLLEVLSKRGTTGDLEPSPSTILQCLEPDVVSFNTILKAWSEFSPKKRGYNADEDQDLSDVGTVVAERAESILDQMQSLWDEERSTLTTLKSIRSAWEGCGEADGPGGKLAPPPSYRTIAPNSTSYNSVLNAWSRSSDSKAAFRALREYRSMVGRSNIACHARDSLALEREPVELIFPDSRTLVHLLQSLQKLAKSIGFRDAFDAIHLVMNSMKQWDKQIEWSAEKRIAPLKDSICLNAFSYNTLITTLSKLPRSWEENYQCCLRIDSIIERMPHSSLRPNAAVSWVKCAAYAGNEEQLQLCAEKSGAHIDALLDSMKSHGDNQFSESGKHYIHAITDVIELYGRAGFPSKADELFRRAKSKNLHSLGILSSIIGALCHDRTEDIAFVDKAKQYLLDFESEMMRMSHLLVAPDMKYTKMYNSVIAGYLNCSMKERGMKNAQALLTHMLSSYETNPRHIARPNTTSFARVMSALAQRGDNTRLLEDLLKKMEELNQRRMRVLGRSVDAELAAHVVPNIVVYNILLKAYARSKDEDALQSAMKMLAQMEADPTISRDEISNSYILQLLSRKDDGIDITTTSPGDGILGSSEMVNLDSANTQLEDLHSDNIHLDDLNLNGQDHPSSKSLTSIINVQLTTGTIEGAQKGAALFEKLVEMHRIGSSGFKPDIILYNKVMNAWRLCEPNNNDNANSPAEKAQEILDSICDEHDLGGELSPNDVTFSIGIHAWCKSNRSDAANRAEQILRRKEEYAKKCNDVTIKTSDYTPIISKWKDDHVNGPERATLLFEEMLQRYDNVESRPDVAALNILLDVYAKWRGRNLADKAEHYLRKMNRLHEEGKIYFSPDVISYRSVIDAWTRSWSKDSPQRVSSLVDEMIHKYRNEGRLDLRPDSNAFNLILKSCSTAPATWEGKETQEKGDDHPIAIANRVFTMLKTENEFSAKVTHATYSYMFTTYRRHLDFRDPRHSSVMQNLWRHCCRDGMVSKFSLESYRESVLEHDFWEGIGGKDNFERLGKTDIETITVDDLPVHWSKGVLPLKRR